MRSFRDDLRRTQVGLAYSAAIGRAIEAGALEPDYVEVPFELMRHDARVLSIADRVPIILHCASLSLAGTSRCPAATLSQIDDWIARTRTPWLGEHLAFVTADKSIADGGGDPYAPGEPYNIGYTVSPVMNSATLERVVVSLERYTSRFSVPLLVENSPIYFALPGTTMTQTAFVRETCRRSGVELLLDISHFIISARTMSFDPMTQIEDLPLERVREIHLSGIQEEDGECWDDHTHAAPELAYALLDRVLRRAAPKAITLEYNWSSQFPIALMNREIARVRELCDRRNVHA